MRHMSGGRRAMMEWNTQDIKKEGIQENNRRKKGKQTRQQKEKVVQ